MMTNVTKAMSFLPPMTGNGSIRPHIYIYTYIGRLWHYFNQIKWKSAGGRNFSCHSAAVWSQVPGPFTRYPWSSLWSRPFWFPGPRPKNSWIGSFATSKRTLDRRGWAAEPCWELGFYVSKPNLKIGSRFKSYLMLISLVGLNQRKGSVSNVQPFSSIFQNLYYRHKMGITYVTGTCGCIPVSNPLWVLQDKIRGLEPLGYV